MLPLTEHENDELEEDEELEGGELEEELEYGDDDEEEDEEDPLDIQYVEVRRLIAWLVDWLINWLTKRLKNENDCRNIMCFAMLVY